MLSYFPKPYPEEDFRSIIYRYHIRTGKLLFEETNRELFSVSSKRNIYFHHNIGELIRLLNLRDYTIEYFLNNHTIFPLIKPFCPDQRIQDFQQSLRIKDSLKNKKIFLDYIAKEIKYCPKCLEDDYKKYGEVYLHRFHQLHFLNYCDRHQLELIYECPKCGVPLSNHNGKELLSRPFCKNGHCLTSIVSHSKDCPYLIKNIIQDIHLITSLSPKLNRNFVVELFYSVLGKLSYGEIYSDNIQKERLTSEFSNFVSNQLEILDVQYHDVIDTHFYKLLTKKSNTVPNILAYLLLIQFTSNSFKEFISDTVGYSIGIPFKNKHYQCLNNICKYYNKQIIRTYTKKYYPMYVKGIFSCPYCGYTYGHTWIWNKDKMSGEVKKPFLISRGELWENEVMQLYYQGLSLKGIATKIGMGTYTDPIVKFLKGKLGEDYAERFNPKTSFAFYNIHSRLEPDNPKYQHSFMEIELGMREVATTTYEQQLLLLRRQNIIDIMDENPNLKRTEIKKLARADYEWLKAKDQEWFERVLPKPLK